MEKLYQVTLGVGKISFSEASILVSYPSEETGARLKTSFSEMNVLEDCIWRLVTFHKDQNVSSIIRPTTGDMKTTFLWPCDRSFNPPRAAPRLFVSAEFSLNVVHSTWHHKIIQYILLTCKQYLPNKSQEQFVAGDLQVVKRKTRQSTSKGCVSRTVAPDPPPSPVERERTPNIPQEYHRPNPTTHQDIHTAPRNGLHHRTRTSPTGACSPAPRLAPPPTPPTRSRTLYPFKDSIWGLRNKSSTRKTSMRECFQP